jgi:hypothetical protein
MQILHVTCHFSNKGSASVVVAAITTAVAERGNSYAMVDSAICQIFLRHFFPDIVFWIFI